MKPTYEELQEQLENTQREFRSADITMQNLEAKCEKLAAENAYLLPKAASELSNAWVLHKYLIGIQAAIMYLDGGSKKAAQEWLYGTIAGPGFEFPDEVDDIDAWATHQLRGSISHPQALEIIKAETPATDAFLAEVRASALPENIAEIIDSGDLETICWQHEHYKAEDYRLSLYRFRTDRAAQLRKWPAKPCPHCGGTGTCSEHGCTATDQMLEQRRASQGDAQ